MILKAEKNLGAMQSCPNFIDIHDYVLLYKVATLNCDSFQRKNLIKIKKNVITSDQFPNFLFLSQIHRERPRPLINLIFWSSFYECKGKYNPMLL